MFVSLYNIILSITDYLMILTEDLHRLINLCDGKFLFSSNEVISKAINGSKGTAIKVNNMETIYI